MHTPNPHDIFVRKIFSWREESIEFFRVTLPPEVLELLNLDGLEDLQESFLSEEQREHRTDKFYRIPLKKPMREEDAIDPHVYAYLLFEHKSYYDPNIYTQVLSYLAQIYQWQRENLKEYRVVIPFVFYHGEKGWDMGKAFLDVFDMGGESDLIRYVPNFGIELFQLKSQARIFPTQKNSLKILFRILASIRLESEEFILEYMESIRDLSHESEVWKRIAIFQMLLEYMNRVREDADIIFEKEIPMELEMEKMTYFDRLQYKAKLEGIQEGKAEGILEGKIEDARLMSHKGYPISDILEITGLSLNDLKANGIE